MRHNLLNTVIFLFLVPCFIYGQKKQWEPFYIKIKTESEQRSGNLLAIGDSSIWIMNRRNEEAQKIPVNLIEYIKVKRPVLKTAIVDLAAGAGLVLFIDCLSYFNYWERKWQGRDASGYEPDLPFAKSLLYSVIVGGSSGFLFGLAQASIFKLKIPINKSQRLLEGSRKKLSKYVVY